MRKRKRRKIGSWSLFDDGFVMRLIAVIVRDGSILAVDGNFFKRQAASSAGLTDADDDVRIKFIDALFKQRTVFSKNDRQAENMYLSSDFPLF